MQRDDVAGLIGGLMCLAFAYFDEGWRPFWLTAGAVLLLWTAISLAWQQR